MEHILLPENGYTFAARIRCLCVNCIYFQKAATFSYPFYGYNFVAAFASKNMEIPNRAAAKVEMWHESVAILWQRNGCRFLATLCLSRRMSAR